MSTVMAVSPFLLLVAAGLAIMLLDAFVHERAELAFVTAVSLFGAAALAGAGAIFGVHGPLPSALTSYLAIDRFSFFFQSVICLGGAMMGFGARMADGCTSGHAIAGVALLNWPSMVAGAGFFVGGIMAVQTLFRVIG